MSHLLRITEVRDGLEREGADDGDQGEEARCQEDHPGVPRQQQDVPETWSSSSPHTEIIVDVIDKVQRRLVNGSIQPQLSSMKLRAPAPGITRTGCSVIITFAEENIKVG